MLIQVDDLGGLVGRRRFDRRILLGRGRFFGPRFNDAAFALPLGRGRFFFFSAEQFESASAFLRFTRRFFNDKTLD